MVIYILIVPGSSHQNCTTQQGLSVFLLHLSLLSRNSFDQNTEIRPLSFTFAMFLAYIITATSTLNYCPGRSWGFQVFVEWILLSFLFLYTWRELQGVFIFTMHLAWSQPYLNATLFTQITMTLFSELHFIFLICHWQFLD